MHFSKLLTLGCLLAALFLTSCGTFSEEIWINADGTGRYKLDYDASESLAMLEMFSQMEDSDSASDSESTEDVMKDALAQEKFDTSFNLMSAMPDSVKQIIGSKSAIRKTFTDRGEKISDAKIDTLQRAFKSLEQLDFAMRIDKEAGVLGFGMTINFDQANEIANVFSNMAALKTLDADESDTGEMADKMGNRTTFELKGNRLIVRQAPAAKMDDLLRAAGDDADGMDSEQMEGMLEMMGMSKYKVIVHVPGLVKSVTGADFVKEDDNTVVLSVDYLKAMKGGDLMEAEILFKPKRKLRMTVPK